MKKNSIILVGNRKSDCKSSFAAFESFGDWAMLRKTKVIPEGMYFVVVIPQNERKIDIVPDLFVQGYRPHSSSAEMYVDKRRYGRFVTETVEFADDLPIFSSQLYQVIGERQVRLVLMEGESLEQDKIAALAGDICKELKLEQMSDLNTVMYHCSASSGYFLKQRDYKVWAMMVGERKDLCLVKKVLVFDFGTGIPGIVEYKAGDFEGI